MNKLNEMTEMEKDALIKHLDDSVSAILEKHGVPTKVLFTTTRPDRITIQCGDDED